MIDDSRLKRFWDFLEVFKLWLKLNSLNIFRQLSLIVIICQR